ncbi:hypothetical protein AB0N09_05780 [Streptomyces erythrochromogenes]|uniref:hypothetical protein n=1 Tax=Streptomyces erythrochromogenes TaxID=285574 RepID=UPI00341C6178
MEGQEQADRLRLLKEGEEERRRLRVAALRRASQERQAHDEARTTANQPGEIHYAELPRHSPYGIR